MATIRIREVPEDAYQVISKRARASGRSIQSFMLDWVVQFARHPTADELLATLETYLASSPTPGASRESILDDLGADRW